MKNLFNKRSLINFIFDSRNYGILLQKTLTVRIKPMKKNLFRFFLLPFLISGLTNVHAQMSCDSVVQYIHSGVIFEKGIFGGGDSVLMIPLKNVSVAQYYAYPMAKLNVLSPLPAGMSLVTSSSDYVVFASSFNPGDVYPVQFFFQVNQAIPANFLVTLKLYGKFEPGQPVPDTCVFDSSFVVNLNPQGSSGLLENKKERHGFLFPNPAADYIRLQSKSNEYSPLSTYEIINLEGLIIARGEFIKGKNIDVSFLPPGIYFVRENFADFSYRNYKFVKCVGSAND
jgi:hypothetical protein